VGVHGLIAPNDIVIRLSPDDVERFETFAEALARELADAVREHARAENYGFVGPVEVTIVEDQDLRTGRFEVEASVKEGGDGLSAAAVVMPDGERIPLGPDPLVIGRLPECVIVLNDPNVSRRHAEIRRVGSEVHLVDLGSTNGSKVNGAPVREQRLKDGDEITIGTSTLRFESS
jgi:hypothetical protein